MPDGRYGALILAFEPDGTDEAAEINNIIGSMTTPGWVTLVFDEESKTVVYSSDPSLIGFEAVELGIPEDSIRDNYMDTFYLLNQRSYGFSRAKNDLVYYNICTTNGMLRSTLRHGLMCGAGFAVIYLILSVYLLFGYTNRWYGYYSVIGSEFDSRGSETVLANGKVKRSIDPSRRWAFSFTNWRNQLPEQTAKSVFNLCLGLSMALGIVDALVNRTTSNGILIFIVSGIWNRGFNLFAIVAILLLCLVAFFGLIVVKLALKLTSMALDTKGETICSLCFNLLQYVTVIMLLFYAFEFFGIDVRALLAPLALVSLALSIGSRDLVQDILAGITIVFEGEYQVGDVIDVGGYRGKVVEIGVRTTKLLGRGDNIKIISNRDVRNVLNMSRMNSWIDMEFTLSNTFPMQKIEEIMNRELPEMGRSIPDIISGPIYKGIVSMNGNKVTIAVTCECNEEVSYRVQRELYAKFHEVFERESLPLA
jgi:small conductance mechanosensitive channel